MSEKKMVAVNISHVPFNKLHCVIRAMMIGLVDTGIEVLKISSRTRPFFIETSSVMIKFIRNDPKYIKGTRWDAMFDFPEEIVKERVYPRPIFEGSLIEYVRKVEEEQDGGKEDAAPIDDTCDGCVHMNGGIGEDVCFICTRNTLSVRWACTDHFSERRIL